ncbi:hypothetical protein [Labrys miyagiensis]|uniref:hypothetical protein n=1 Tax=Labrys miyagiensis TaxID=346912 RepID=UPI003D6781A5
MVVTIAGKRFRLWRAVDGEGEVLGLLVRRAHRDLHQPICFLSLWNPYGDRRTSERRYCPLRKDNRICVRLHLILRGADCFHVSYHALEET